MEIINQPELQLYVDRFGTRKGDVCFVAESDGLIVGAVWVSQTDKYVDDGIFFGRYRKGRVTK